MENGELIMEAIMVKFGVIFGLIQLLWGNSSAIANPVALSNFSETAIASAQKHEVQFVIQNPQISKKLLTARTLGQKLPITAQAVINNQVINLEVAVTPKQQQIGLMYRESLPKNRGMLFNFKQPRYLKFWMRNVTIHLDMVFLRDGKVVAIFSNVPPCITTTCPTYGPNTKSNQVIELSQGRASTLGLKVGDHVTIKYLDN